MTENTDKKQRGRPVKNEIKPIPAPAEKIAKAIFFAADKKIEKPDASLSRCAKFIE